MPITILGDSDSVPAVAMLGQRSRSRVMKWLARRPQVCMVCVSQERSSSYLCPRDHVFIRVCLSVSRITQKL